MTGIERPGIKFDIHDSSRKGLSQLASARVESGGAAVLGITDKDKAAEIIGEHFHRKVTNLSNEKLAPAYDERPLLAAQMETLPVYFSRLFNHLGLAEATRNMVMPLAEAWVSESGSHRGHYDAPFPVVRNTEEMKNAQHALGTLVHEVTHAFGRLVLSNKGSAYRPLKDGLLLLKSGEDPASESSAFFRYFNEGLCTLTQCHFLTDFMNFKAERNWNQTTSFKPEHRFKLNNIDITDALTRCELLTPKTEPNTNGGEPIKKIELTLGFTRYYQGDKYDENNKSQEAQRDRQFLSYKSGYALLTHHLLLLSHELYPELRYVEAEKALHRDLMTAQIKGDFQPIAQKIKGVFPASEQAGYLKFLSKLSNVEGSMQNMELVAFCAFVKAGQCGKETATEVRRQIVQAFLASEHKTEES